MERRASPIVCTLIATGLAVGLAGCRGNGTIGQRLLPGQTAGPANSGGPSTVAGGAAPPKPGAGAPTNGGNGLPAAPPAPGLVAGMPDEVRNLLQARCSGCHTYGQADPAGWGAVLDMSRLSNADVVVPGQPESSRMIDRVAVVGNMPPTGPRLSVDEVMVLTITGAYETRRRSYELLMGAFQ